MLTVAPKPTPVAQVDANGRIQAHSGGTSRLIAILSPLRRQTYSFSLIFIRFGFPENAFRFLYLKSTLRGTKLTTTVASKVRFTRQSKVDFFSRNSKSAPRGILKSTSVFKSPLKVRSARHKVDFGF
jgi:hypothetical protein